MSTVKTLCMLSKWMILGSLVLRASAQGDPPRPFDKATAAVRKTGTTVRIDLIGDSTQTDHAGYGRGFCANLTAAVDCVNLAKGGASTKTYRDQGLWAQALATRPDYMLIQFGHNDMPSADHAARQTTMAEYEANLRSFITEARAAGIVPLLVTPLSRRYFGPDGKVHSDLIGHAETMKRVATEMQVPLIDLHKESVALLDGIGETKAATLGITKKDTDGKTISDKTHLDWAGSYVFGRIVAKEMGEDVLVLAKYVRPEAAKLPPEGIRGMHVIQGGPVKIVLVGDSTVATGGGWGPGFCAVMTPNVTCVDVALNGRSTKSFVDEGAWKRALAEKGDYYLIQFGHNDQKADPARHTDAAGSFQTYLKGFVADVRSMGAVPILVTSLSRRTFRDGKVVEDLNEYASATREVAAAEGISLVDLNRLSTTLLNHMTQAEADRYDAVGNPDQAAENKGPAKLDRTHLNPVGQALFGRMVADAVIRTEVELGPDVKGEVAGKGLVPTFTAPQTPDAVDAK